MSKDQKMTITEIMALANSEGFDVFKGADICASSVKGRYEVQFDYGDANVSCWESHEGARQEAARLWTEGLASHIFDRIVEETGKRIAARHEEFDRRMNAAANEVRAELRDS